MFYHSRYWRATDSGFVQNYGEADPQEAWDCLAKALSAREPLRAICKTSVAPNGPNF